MRRLGRPPHLEVEKWQPFLFFLYGCSHHLLLSMCQCLVTFVWLTETPTSPQYLSSPSSLQTESLNLSWVPSGPGDRCLSSLPGGSAWSWNLIGDVTRRSGHKNCTYIEKSCPSKSLPPDQDVLRHREELKESVVSTHLPTNSIYSC